MLKAYSAWMAREQCDVAIDSMPDAKGTIDGVS